LGGRATAEGAQCVFNHPFSVINCMVRHQSDGAACLQVATSVGIPDRFHLTIGPDGSSRPCEVAWRLEQGIGVAFR
jgi:hypothetical protein